MVREIIKKDKDCLVIFLDGVCKNKFFNNFGFCFKILLGTYYLLSFTQELIKYNILCSSNKYKGQLSSNQKNAVNC